MTRKKLLLYGSVLGIFIVFWTVYTVVMFGAMSKSSEQSLRDTTTSAELLVDKSLEYTGKELVFRLADIDEDSITGAEDLYTPLASLPGEYLVGGSDGRLYDTAGRDFITALDPAVLRSADMEGYTLVPIVNLEHDWDGVAVVTGFAGAYVGQYYSQEQFLQLLTASLTFEADYAALYNAYGTPLFGEGGDSGASVDAGAFTFTNAEENILVSAAGRQQYNIYIGLQAPAGWFIGLHIRAAQAVPMYTSIVQTSILALVSWLLLISLIIFLDVTNDKEKKKELVRASKTDALTGLINSSGMEEAISSFFKKEPQTDYSLVVLDVVAFSRFNTMFGNVVGDSLLRVIADVLKTHYQCATRMSGDVFAFVAKSSEDLSAQAETRLLDAVERELGKQYNQLVAFKFGVYPIRDSSHSFREIYDGAIIALKDAKKIPEQSGVVFDEGLQQSVDLQRNIEINMLHALSKEEFLSYIQPKFDVATEAVCGGELLVRWNSEQMGMLMPGQFIPLFEKNGFIVELDFYMMASALNITKGRLAAGQKMVPLSVNLSRITLTFPNFLERLTALVKGYEQALQYVEIEITESALENSSESVIPLVNQIKALGFHIAMDDFGTGFSSLNTLRELPVDVLKIDKEFLRESDTSGRSRKIIRNITNMSKELGILVVCEGVETATQVEFLRDAGCDIAQGFYFAKPMPQQQFEAEYLA